MNFLTQRLSCKIHAYIRALVPHSNANHVNAAVSRLVGWRKVGDGLGWLKLISPPSAAHEEPENMQF